MTLVAGLSYPRIIQEINQNEYWDIKEIEISSNTESIVIVSDSRITNGNGDYKDIAQKISQISSDCIIAYAGNVKLAESVYKSIHYRLNVKRKYYDGVGEFLNIFRDTILHFKKQLESNYNFEFITDFFVGTVSDENVPVLYLFSQFNNNYKPIKMLVDDFYVCIGQNITDQEFLKVDITKAILEMKSVSEQLEQGKEINLSLLDLSIAVRNGFRKFTEKTNIYPNRITVGGPLLAISIKPNPIGVEMLNEWKYDLVTEDYVTTIFNSRKNSWEKISKDEYQRLFTEPSTRFY